MIWSLVTATAMFWILRFSVRAPQAPAYAVSVARSTPVRGDLARLFGAALPARVEERAAAPSRYRLLGVMAPKSQVFEGSGAYGLALIAVDGKPARAYAVGARIDEGVVLQSVGSRTASLGSGLGSGRMLLELPALPVAATGVLPIPGTGTSATVRPGAPVPPLPSAQAPMGALPPGTPVMQPQIAIPDDSGAVPGHPPNDRLRAQ